MLLVEILRRNGYAPVEAETAEDAFAAALTDPPDVLVVDYHLGERSGADLIREVRAASSEELRSLPIVGLSGRRGSERPLLDAGASCFLEKPFTEPQVLKAVSWAIEVYGAASVRRPS